jgi:hypothetical protein
VAITTIPWRAGAARRALPAQTAAEPRTRPLRKDGAAASTVDHFMDLVVLLSVLLFVLLAVGVGLLALQANWPSLSPL